MADRAAIKAVYETAARNLTAQAGAERQTLLALRDYALHTAKERRRDEDSPEAAQFWRAFAHDVNALLDRYFG